MTINLFIGARKISNELGTFSALFARFFISYLFLEQEEKEEEGEEDEKEEEGEGEKEEEEGEEEEENEEGEEGGNEE